MVRDRRRGFFPRGKTLVFAFIILFASASACCSWGASYPHTPTTNESLVDLHVHVAGIGVGESGAFISEHMRESYKFPIYLWALGTSMKEIEKKGDRIVVKHLSKKIAESKRVSKAVVLAMDGVIDSSGKLDKKKTEIYVPNDYLAEEVSKYENLLFGASVNPYRPDALERLETVKKDGAVLLKWIPCIMAINPADEKIIPFYKKLIELKLPLLAHVGQERSFMGSKDELCDPVRLELPLELGVTVIAAHIATTGENEGTPNHLRLLPLFEKYQNLYADISSLTQVNKLGYLKEILKDGRGKGRLVYGSDWPLQFFPLVSPWYQLKHLSFRQAAHVSQLKNQWDKDVVLKELLGVPAETFLRSSELIGVP